MSLSLSLSTIASLFYSCSMQYNWGVPPLHNISFSVSRILEPKVAMLSGAETGRIIYSNQSVTINLAVALAGFLFILACK